MAAENYSKVPVTPGRWYARRRDHNGGRWYAFEVDELTDGSWVAKRVGMEAFQLKEWEALDDWLACGWVEWSSTVCV